MTTALQESLQLCVTVRGMFSTCLSGSLAESCLECTLYASHATWQRCTQTTPHVVIAGSYRKPPPPPRPAPSAGRREGGRFIRLPIRAGEKNKNKKTQNTVSVTWPRKQEGEVLFQDQSQEGGAGRIGSRHGPISLRREPVSQFCSLACQGAVARNKEATNRAHNVPNGAPSPAII